MHNKRGPKKPRFPRKQWVAGQAPRVETPAKGKGSYRRGKGGGAGDAAGVIDEALENRHRPHDGDA